VTLQLINGRRVMTEATMSRVAGARVAVTRVDVLTTSETAATRRIVDTTTLVLCHAARWHYRRPTRINLMMMRRHDNQNDSNSSQPPQHWTRHFLQTQKFGFGCKMFIVHNYYTDVCST